MENLLIMCDELNNGRFKIQTSFACKLKKMQVSYISIQILIWKVLPDKLLVGKFALHLLLQFLFL